MIFLISKIFIYLMLAGVIGGAAGWLFRNLQAQRSEESASRAMNDAKSKLPQLESLLRGRDEQIEKLKRQLQDGKARLGEQEQQSRANEQKLREQEREAKRWQQAAEAKKFAAGEDFELSAEAENDSGHEGDTNHLIAELSQEIARLKDQLTQAQAGADRSATSVGDETLLQVELEALRGQLAKAEKSLAEATMDLVDEQNKVVELERERELQSKSLQVLHQQLELERTRRVSAG